MLPDTTFDTGSGRTFRCFSVEHLLWQNLSKALGPEEIASTLAAAARQSPEWLHAKATGSIAQRLVRRLCPDLAPELRAAIEAAPFEPRLDAASDRLLAQAAVQLGHGLGLAAAWGVSREADLLWAAAAALTRHHGCEHPNEIPEPVEPVTL